MNDDILGYECKHAVYTESTQNYTDDLLTIKEKIYYKDGRIEPNLRFVKNWVREIGVTRPEHRNHKDKKECEELKKLQVIKTTQRGMLRAVEKALGRVFDGGMRTASLSPYVYGCDISTPTMIKQMYMQKFPDLISENDLAVMDIESDTIKGHERPIIVSATFRQKAVITIDKDFLRGIPNPEKAIHEAFEQYLGNVKKERKIDLEVKLVDTIGQGICHVIGRLHEWKPDIVAFWNINYDFPKMLEVLQREGIDPVDVFCDPKVPVEFRYFNYREGQAKKITASGREMTLSPEERWHVVTCPASFIFLDAMCVYQKIRIAKGKEPSYALDAILQKILGMRKLKIKEGEDKIKLAWHMYMQRHHPIFYCIYNLWDDISVELLDEKTTDLRRTISLLCKASEYARFSSQPKRTCDELYFFFKEHGYMAATTSRKMRDDMDDDTIGLDEWIVTLSSYMVDDVGLAIIEECPNIRTSIYAQVADLDVAATYPTEEVAMNISKATTKRELCEIEGVMEEQRRCQGINLTGGHNNAVQIAVAWFHAPTFSQMLEAYEKHLGIEPQPSMLTVEPPMQVEQAVVSELEVLMNDIREQDVTTVSEALELMPA